MQDSLALGELDEKLIASVEATPNVASLIELEPPQITEPVIDDKTKNEQITELVIEG